MCQRRFASHISVECSDPRDKRPQEVTPWRHQEMPPGIVG
jgi:hypothetical protein